MDSPVTDDATGKVVNDAQKPLKFMDELIGLYSAPGDWVLDGLGGIGECIFASMIVHKVMIIMVANNSHYIGDYACAAVALDIKGL